MSDERLAPLYERNIRRAAQGEQLYDLPSSLLPLLAEFDRLRAVEKAAAALVEEFDSPAPDYTMRQILRNRLRDALNGDTT